MTNTFYFCPGIGGNMPFLIKIKAACRHFRVCFCVLWIYMLICLAPSLGWRIADERVHHPLSTNADHCAKIIQCRLSTKTLCTERPPELFAPCFVSYHLFVKEWLTHTVKYLYLLIIVSLLPFHLFHCIIFTQIIIVKDRRKE